MHEPLWGLFGWDDPLRLRGVHRGQGSRGAGEQRSRGAGEQRSSYQ
ncbi:hypothetical protein [Chroococcidiopsis sp.]